MLAFKVLDKRCASRKVSVGARMGGAFFSCFVHGLLLIVIYYSFAMPCVWLAQIRRIHHELAKVKWSFVGVTRASLLVRFCKEDGKMIRAQFAKNRWYAAKKSFSCET